MDFIYSTFLGLENRYHIRNLIIGALFVILSWGVLDYSLAAASVSIEDSYIYIVKAYFVVCALLYPYSKFAYDWVWDFLFGESEWFVGGLLLLIVWYFKLIIRLMLYTLSIFIAPIGLIILYFENR